MVKSKGQIFYPNIPSINETQVEDGLDPGKTNNEPYFEEP